MRAMIVIAIMAGTMFMITLSQAAETDKDKSKPSMEKKQGDKEKEKKTKRAVPGGSMGEERTGESGPSGTSGRENAPQHEGFGSKKKQ